MRKHTSSRNSLVLVTVLGLCVIGSLIASWLATTRLAADMPPMDIPRPVPPTGGITPPFTPPPPLEARVERRNYRTALFEVTCARAKIEDARLLAVTIDEIHARYGYDGASFARMQEEMVGDTHATALLAADMEDCTSELAASLVPNRHTEAATDRVWRAGRYTDEEVQGSGLQRPVLRLSIDDDGKVRAFFQGRRDGKGFAIPLAGEIDRDGSLIATGSRGPDNGRLVGRYKDGKIAGAVNGIIHKAGYRVNYAAQDPSLAAIEPERPAAVAPTAGAFQDDDVRGTDIEKAHLRLKVRADGTTVVGSFQGLRDGKGFSIPFKGELQQGEVEAQGTRGRNTVRVTGKHGPDGVRGTLEGLIYRHDYRVTFNAE